MRISIKYILLFLVFGFSFCAHAQETTSSTEFWPEVDLWLRLTPKWRFSMYLPLSKNIETKYREGNIVAQMDYSWGKPSRFIMQTRLLDDNENSSIKANMARFGYLRGFSLGDRGENYTEKTIFGEYHRRVQFKRHFLITHRARTDLRWMGKDSDFSARFRYKVNLEKEITIKKYSIVPYFNAEAYYDTRYQTVNRYRIIGGGSVSWSSRYAVEANITYQNDSRMSITNLYAFNAILHLFIEKKKPKEPLEDTQTKP